MTKDETMNLSSLSEDTEESFSTRGTLSSHKGTISSSASSLSSQSTICIHNETIEFYQRNGKNDETDILLDELLSPSSLATISTTTNSSFISPAPSVAASVVSESLNLSINLTVEENAADDNNNDDDDIDATWRWTNEEDENSNDEITWKNSYSPIK